MVAALVTSQFKDSRKIYFPKSISSGLKCEKCKYLLKNPMQTTCGHRFCKKCSEELIKDSSGVARCPVDQKELTRKDIFYDRCCERDINNLECYCYNFDKDCKWLGQLRHLEKHEKTKCPYSMEECPNPGCDEKMERRNLDDHVNKTCDFRLITCENCGANVIHRNEELHRDNCPKVEVSCTQGCGAMVPRGDLKEHVTRQCVNAPVACQFEQSGCFFKGSRGDVDEHESSAMPKHIQILNDQSKESSEILHGLEERIKELEAAKERLEAQVQESREALAYTKQDLQTQQTKLGITEKTISKQKEELGQLKEIVDKIQHEGGTDTVIESQLGEMISLLESQGKRITELEAELIRDREAGMSTSYLGTNSMSSDRRLERNEHICAVSEARIDQHDIRLQMLEATSYDGTYIWKIDEWSKRVREARIGKTTSIYSPPFYVGRYGYKVCGRLYPCGDGIGKDSHISMFFVVMKGECDALLPWPFRQKVTFRLIDPNHRQDVTDSFRPDPNSSSFQRPKSAMNIASGTPQFVSQMDLSNRGYVVEDTLFIKITVDRAGLREL